MADRTCSLSGCDRRHYARGYCHTHYERWRTTGDAGLAEIAPFRAPRGRLCSIEGCGGRHMGRGYCQTHLYRLRENGDPLLVNPGGPPPGPISWAGDDVGYSAVHRRLRSNRGRASDQQCSDCDDGAQEWAYNHSAKNEKVDPESGKPYSTDLGDYRPMCRSCHRKFDANRLVERVLLLDMAHGAGEVQLG